VSIFLEGSAADGSADQLLGSLTGSSSPSGVPSLLLGAADGTTALPAGGESAVTEHCVVSHSYVILPFCELGFASGLIGGSRGDCLSPESRGHESTRQC